MGDEHDGSRVGLQGVLQHVTTGKVEVVGGLVQDQEVDRYGQCLGQCQAGLFATRQVAHTAVYGVAPEAEGSQVGAGVTTVDPHARHCLELFEHRAPVVEHLGLELVEVGQVDIGSPTHPSRQGRHLAGDETDESGLSRSVRADERHLATPFHVEGDVSQNDLVAAAACTSGRRGV